MKDIKTAEWYPALLDDLLSAYIETQFVAREVAIQRYHHWGHSISQVIESWGDLKYTANQLYDQLAADFEARKKRSVSKRSFYYALKFYQTFPKLEDFLAGQGKDLSWHKIVRQHLTESLSPLSDGSAQEDKEIDPATLSLSRVSAPGLAQFISTKKMLEWLGEQERELMEPVSLSGRPALDYHFEKKEIIFALRALILDYGRLKKLEVERQQDELSKFSKLCLDERDFEEGK